MKITVRFDEDLFEELKCYAERRGTGLGKAVSELVRKGIHAPLRTRIVNGFHVVELPPDSPIVSSADVNKLKD